VGAVPPRGSATQAGLAASPQAVELTTHSNTEHIDSQLLTLNLRPLNPRSILPFIVK